MTTARKATRKKRPAKIKAEKKHPVRIGNKLVSVSREVTLTLTDVEGSDER